MLNKVQDVKVSDTTTAAITTKVPYKKNYTITLLSTIHCSTTATSGLVHGWAETGERNLSVLINFYFKLANPEYSFYLVANEKHIG